MGHHLWAVLELRLHKLRSHRPSMLRRLPHTAQCTSSNDTTRNTHDAAINTSDCGIFDPGSTADADAAINTPDGGIFDPGSTAYADAAINTPTGGTSEPCSATDANADADATCTARQFRWHFAMGRCLMPGSHSSMASSSSGTTMAPPGLPGTSGHSK